MYLRLIFALSCTFLPLSLHSAALADNDGDDEKEYSPPPVPPQPQPMGSSSSIQGTDLSLNRSAAHADLLQEIQKILKAAGDANYKKRETARKKLVQLMQVAPQHATEVLPILLKAVEDKDAWVRIAACETLGKLVQVAPEYAKQVLPLLTEMAEHYDDGVYASGSTFFEECGQLVMQYVEYVTEVRQVLQKTIEDKNENRFVRQAACEALGELVQAAPQHAAQILPILKEARMKMCALRP